MPAHENVTLEAAPASSRKARAVVTEWLGAIGHPEFSETAALVVAELVANAIKHGGPHIELDLTAADDAIRIAVFDSAVATHDIAPQSPSLDRPHGRGLVMVQKLVTRWGHDDAPNGKTVWAEIDMARNRNASHV